MKLEILGKSETPVIGPTDTDVKIEDVAIGKYCTKIEYTVDAMTAPEIVLHMLPSQCLTIRHANAKVFLDIEGTMFEIQKVHKQED